jgi:hypothetical protein
MSHSNEDVAAVAGGGIPPLKFCEMIAALPFHYRDKRSPALRAGSRLFDLVAKRAGQRNEHNLMEIKA